MHSMHSIQLDLSALYLLYLPIYCILNTSMKEHYLSTIIVAVLACMIMEVRAWCENARFTDIGPVLCVDYSPDNTMIMTTTATQVTIWERVTKNILWTKTASAKCAKFSRDKPSSYIAIFTTGLDVQLYAGTLPFAPLHTITTSLGGGSAGTIDFNPAGQIIVCGGTNNKIKTYTLTSTTSTIDFDGSYTNALVCKFQTNSKIGIASTGGSAKLDFTTITAPLTFASALSKTLVCNDIDFSADAKYMIAACSTGSKNGVFIDLTTGTQTDIITSGNMLSSEYSMDGQTFAYGGADKNLYILNGTSANKTIMSQFLQNSNVQDTDFTDDGMYLVAGTADGTVYQYIKYCLTCRPGFWANMATKTCDNCETTIQGCSFCSSALVCLQCYQNYIIDTTTKKCLSCSALMTGCSTCIDASTCRYCSPGYYLDTSSCLTCQSSMQGCYICNASNYCSECESDFYLDTATHTCKGCETVNANCIKCSSATTCTSCKIGYYQQSGGCTVCSTNCYACQSATNCTDCITGYYPLLSGGSITCARCGTGCLACNATGSCKDCADDRYLDGSGNCVQCSSPCVTCNASAYCLSCQVSYFSNGAGGCTPCSSGCVTCNSSSYCLSCSPGYYLDTGTDTCKQCQLTITGCMQCTNTSCLKCQIGFYLSSATACSSCLTAMIACVSCQSATSCSFCAAGYYLGTGTGNSSCQICPLGCTTCLASNNCTSCNVGYYYTSATASCSPCAGNCHTCTTSTACLQCEIGYRLGAAGACVSCSLDISGCQSCVYNYTASALWCLSCQLGKYIDASGQCASCPTNCTTCANTSYCLTCEIGQYVDSTTRLCLACNSNCSQCSGSATNCSSCIASYYLTATSTCAHCSAFGCATCNSTTHDCLSCQLGFYLKTVTGPPTKICENCLSAIANCYMCSSATNCLQCSYGYAIAANFLSCQPCSAIQGCKHCAVLTSCQNCQIGYYLTIDGSGNGVCSECPLGCKECDSTGVCLVCSAGYSLLTSPTVSCKLCESSMEGCLICLDASTCQTCLPGYYLDTGTNTCKLCSDPMLACQYCNSSSICTHCQDGFYLSSSNTCSQCNNAMVGCQLCNSSTVCLSCQFGMYLNSNNCYPCITNLPSCLYCLDLNTCLQCDAGYYLAASVCQNCQAHITGCIVCNSAAQCLQCRGGYYLNAGTQLCSPCSQEGCEICKQSDALKCVKCNARYYMNSTLSNCILCRTQIPGCLECVNSTRCKDCDPGYFVNSLYQCQLCSTALNGCGRCISSTTCLECKSGYYIHTDNTCRECKLQMPGCSYCINSTVCQSCYHGYYKNASNLCQDCTTITGCLSCLNSTYCQYCQTSYFLQLTDHQCYPCNVMQGCYACTTNKTCAICTGGYIINDNFLCQVMRVQAYETIKDLKLVTKYMNQSCLIHYLYAKDMSYTQVNDINWVKTTKLVLEDNKYNQVDLNIINVQWGPNSYTLIIYTDNPLQLDQNNFELVKRRMLLDGALASKYKVNLRMDQKTINTILPQFYLPKDLVMGYDIGAPEFVMSYANSSSRFIFYSIFGYVVTGLLLLKYLFKAIYSVPGSSQMGDILPQIASLKAPAFIIYPSFMQFVFYCSGFMLPDIPWANQSMGKLFGDISDKTPQPYALFYANMNIGSTYFIALVVQIVIGFVLWMLYKSKQHEQYKERFPIGTVLYHFFIFGATWAGCACLQGALLNPIQTINLNSGLYMVGIAYYCIILAYSLREVYIDKKNMYKIRLFIKASLLSTANISPIYIFCAAILTDLVLLIIEYNFSTVHRNYPKLWLAKNILCDLALCILAFLPSIMLSLILASFLVVVAIIIDIFTHIKQYKQANKRKKFQTKNLSQNQSTVDVNVWNINFEKDNDQLEGEEVIEQDPGRKTGLGNTKQTFMTSNANGFKREERRKKHRQTKDKEDIKADVLNIRDLQNTIKNERRGFQEQDNNETFVASNFLK